MEGIAEIGEGAMAEGSGKRAMRGNRCEPRRAEVRSDAPAGLLDGVMLSRFEADRRRVDPRIAIGVLIILNVAVFVSGAKAIELAAVAADALLMLWCHRVRLAMGWLIAYAALTLLMLACMAAGPFFMPVGSCLMMLTRLFPTVMFAAALIATTYLGELACALQSFGLSGRMTVAVCVGMRFFPTIVREARAVREAMLTRGVRLTPARVVRHPAQVMEDFMVPYIHRVSIVADELGDAVMARGVETTRKRGCYRELRLTALDVVVACGALVLLAAAFVGRLGI